MIEVGERTFPVALHAGPSTSERGSLHILNRRTGHRMSRIYVDLDTERPVEREDQVKGYEGDDGRSVVLEPEEIAGAVPETDRRRRVEAFIPREEIDTLYLDRPYYLTSAAGSAKTAFAVLRDGLSKGKIVAVGRTVSAGAGSVMVRAVADALVARTLEYDHEVRDAGKAFKGVSAPKPDKEMFDLANLIIRIKRGKFDPSKFEDRSRSTSSESLRYPFQNGRGAMDLQSSRSGSFPTPAAGFPASAE
jgi:DNA end-binding protein Ku